ERERPLLVKVRAAADLDLDARIRQARHVGRHEKRRAAEEGEGRNLHARVLHGQQIGNASVDGGTEHADGIEVAALRIQVRLRVAVDLLAQLFARVDSFAGRRTGKFFHFDDDRSRQGDLEGLEAKKPWLFTTTG